MPPTIGGVTIDPQGQTLTVTVTPSAKVYTDAAGTSLASFPARITTRTSYWMSSAQQFTISVKTPQGTEIANGVGGPLVMDIQQGVMEGIAPVLDQPGPEQVSQTAGLAVAAHLAVNALDNGILGDGSDEGAAINAFLTANAAKAVRFPYTSAGYGSSVQVTFPGGIHVYTDRMVIHSTVTSGAAVKWGSGSKHFGHLEIDGTAATSPNLIGWWWNQSQQHGVVGNIYVHGFTGPGSVGWKIDNDGVSGGHYYNRVGKVRIQSCDIGLVMQTAATGPIAINANDWGEVTINGCPTAGVLVDGANGNSFGLLDVEQSIARTDASCGTTSGSPTVTDASVVASDVGRLVKGAGIPAGSFVGTVTPGVSFTLSSTPISNVAVNATATATVSLTLGGAALVLVRCQGLWVNSGWFEGNTWILSVVGADPTKVAGVYINAKFDDTTKISIPDSGGNRAVQLRTDQYAYVYDRQFFISDSGLQMQNSALTQTALFKPAGMSWNRTGGAVFIDDLGNATGDDLVFRTGSSPAEQFRILKAGGVSMKRAKSSGTALAAGDFALSAGWGTTASVGTLTGTDQAAEFTITSAGTGQAANPTCTLTFHDGTWTNAPIVVVQRKDRANQPTVSFTWTVTATTLVLTFVGTPVAAETYVVSFVAMGR